MNKHNQIRCAFIASYYGPYYSNFVSSVLSLNSEMQKRNEYMMFVFPKETEHFNWVSDLLKQGADIVFLDYRPYSCNNYVYLRRIFKKYRINLIYSHFCGWDFSAHFASPFTPIIWHMRMAVNVTDKKKAIKNWIKFRIIGFGKTYHISTSKANTEAINQLHPKHPCITIENAIDFLRLPQSHKPFPSTGIQRLLIFGWAPKVKGLDIVLTACESINSEEKKVELIVSAQEKTHFYLNSRYTDGLPSWIELREPTDNVSKLYEDADIMISASRSEGFSNALAEAIYSGLPAIISDIPGTKWANSFEGTYTFQSGSAKALADALEKCRTLGITEEQRERNKALMSKKYSMDLWNSKVIKVFEQVTTKY